MDVLAIGLDLVEIDRFSKLYGNFEPEVLARCFTPREQATVGTGPERIGRLAGRFAAKEAVLKTIGGLQDGISLTDIEVLSNGEARPTINITGGASEAAKVRGICSWQISLTHSAQSAAAVALAFGTAST